MTRRRFTLSGLLMFLSAANGEESPVSLRGKLDQRQGQPPVLTMAGGRTVTLEGDDPTTGVLRDPRVNGMDFEVIGSQVGDTFRILPIHKRAMFVHQNGKRLFVTYWCAVCAIRTYTPGVCLCCQDQTALDLREKLDN